MIQCDCDEKAKGRASVKKQEEQEEQEEQEQQEEQEEQEDQLR